MYGLSRQSIVLLLSRRSCIIPGCDVDDVHTLYTEKLQYVYGLKKNVIIHFIFDTTPKVLDFVHIPV